jgi:hypothetical protein
VQKYKILFPNKKFFYIFLIISLPKFLNTYESARYRYRKYHNKSRLL